MKNPGIKALLFLALITSAAAAEGGEANLPEELRAGETLLRLNGSGIRKKTFLRIKVYAGGLYLEKKSSDDSEIIDADAPMAIRMVFIYDGVSPGQLIEAWNEGFASSGSTRSQSSGIEEFNSFFTEEAVEGDVYDLVYLPGKGVTVSRNGKVKGTVSGREFKKALFSIWLGPKPADAGLKEALLGQ